MYVDPDGTKAKWWNPKTWNWKKIGKGVGMAFTAIGAIALSVTTFGAGIPLAMGIVAGVTLGAGILTGINAISTIGEGITGYNFMEEGVFQGNSKAYSIYENVTEGIAIVGSLILGVYHSTGHYKAAKYGQKFLGSGYKKAGYTKIGKPRYVSKDGLRQMRFDKPHMKDGVKIGKHLNLEFFNGTDTVPYQHVLYNLFKFWIL